MSTAKLKIVNPGLTEKGGDTIRTALGGFYAFAETEDGQVSLEYSASNQPGGKGTRVQYPDHEFVNYSVILADYVQTASNKVTLPSYTVPAVLVGRPSAIKNDEHWKSVLLGTPYDTSSYDTILSPGADEDNVVSLDIPYNLLSLKKIVSSYYGDYEYLTQGYVYNYYHPSYENHINQFSTPLIPNLYLLNAGYSEKTSGLTAEQISFINLEGETTANDYTMDTLFDEILFKYPPSAQSDVSTAKQNRFWDEQFQYKTYLDLYVDTVFSGSTITGVKPLRNIIFERDFLDLADSVNFKSIPYYMDLSWNRSEQGPIGNFLVTAAMPQQ